MHLYVFGKLKAYPSFLFWPPDSWPAGVCFLSCNLRSVSSSSTSFCKSLKLTPWWWQPYVQTLSDGQVVHHNIHVYYWLIIFSAVQWWKFNTSLSITALNNHSIKKIHFIQFHKNLKCGSAMVHEFKSIAVTKIMWQKWNKLEIIIIHSPIPLSSQRDWGAH